MARILINGEWYEQLAPTSLYESEFENVLVHQAPLLYPTFLVSPFKTTVVAEDGSSARADLALIEKSYRMWWVVEAEMAHHSLHGHVVPQIRTLSRARYGRREAEYLCEKLSLLDNDRVLRMMKGQQPQVLVVVNSAKPEWLPALAAENALLAVFEIFRSDRNHYVFRVNGQHPAQLGNVVSACEFEGLLPRFLRIESPSAIDVGANGRIKIYVDDRITEWLKVESQDRVWLSPIGPNPLVPGQRYSLIRRADGELTFDTAAKRRKT